MPYDPTDRRNVAARMTESLAALGWTTRTEYLAGGLWGTVVLTDDDEATTLVALDPDNDGGAFYVGPDCQSHPAYGIDVLAVEQYGPEAWDSFIRRVSAAVYAVAKFGPHACPDCADRY